MDRFVKTFVALTLVLCAAVLIFLTVAVTDLVTASPHQDRGRVVKHVYRPSYTTTVTVLCGKTSIPVVQFHPEQWCLEVEAHGCLRESTDLGHARYDAINDGADVIVTHLVGGTFGTCDTVSDVAAINS